MSRDVDSVESDLPTPDSVYYVDEVRLPGVGDAPTRCRGLMPVGFCEEGHVGLGRSSCDTRYCPDHWHGWVRKGTESAVARLAAYREAADGWGKRLLHVVASPAADRVSTRQFWEDYRSEAQEAVKAAGVRGGYMIPHPYRTSERADMLFEAAVESGDWEEEWGKWSFLRDIAGGDWEEWERLVEAGPHYHFLGACEDFDPEAIPDGWVVKNVRSFSRFSKRDIESFEDMARAAYYLRTHGGVQRASTHDESLKTRNTASWFGDLHPSSFDPAEELGSVEWQMIQERAAEAIGASRIEAEEEGDDQEAECPVHDECTAAFHPLEELPSQLANAGWMRSIPPKRRHRLRAVELWVFEESVVPPPQVRVSEERTREWLLETGRMYFGPDTSRQTGLSGFGGW